MIVRPRERAILSVHGFAGFQQAFQAGHDLRPATRYGVNNLGIVFFAFVLDAHLDLIAIGFKRDGAAGGAVLLEF